MPCTITSANSNKLKCTLAAKDLGSSKLATNSTSQMNGYLSGAGLNYTRYTVVTAINKYHGQAGGHGEDFQHDFPRSSCGS
jgi:hypothetical protein